MQMQEKIIITISREFGLGGRKIVQDFSKKLNIPLYDTDLIDMTAQRLGVDKGSLHDDEEDLSKDDVGRLLDQFGYGSTLKFYSRAAINVQGDIIREIAEKGDAIFFGRCSDYYLQDDFPSLNIFLYAPLEERIRHIESEYSLTRKKAERLVKRVDNQRHNYYKYVTGVNRGDRSHNNIMLDVHCFGPEGTVDMMMAAVRNRFHLGI